MLEVSVVMATAFRPSQVKLPEGISYAVVTFVEVCKADNDTWRAVHLSEIADYVRGIAEKVMPDVADTMRMLAPWFGLDAENSIAKLDLAGNVLGKLSWEIAYATVVDEWFSHPEGNDEVIVATDKLMEYLQQFVS